MDIKEEAINDIENFINSLDEKRANIFSYWIKQYTSFLKEVFNLPIKILGKVVENRQKY